MLLRIKTSETMFKSLLLLSTKHNLEKQCRIWLRFQSYATRKRFYRRTDIVQNEKKWEVTLDHRRLKTPNGRVLTVNTEPLARAIAAEWDAQREYITQPTMHLTALCNTTLDNPGKLNSHDIANYLLDFIATDTLLFYSEEEELRALQEKKWDPVLEWFCKRYGVKQEVSKNLELPPVTTETRAVLARHFLSYDFSALNDIKQSLGFLKNEKQIDEVVGKRTYLNSIILFALAMCFGMEALKSPILMLACVDQYVEAKDAVMLARLEEEYQLTHWGRVPWAHELNQAELTARVAASLLVIYSSSERHSAAAKKTHEQHV